MRIIIILSIFLMPILLLSKTIIVKDSLNQRVISSSFAYGNDTKIFEKANVKGEINLNKFKDLDSINIFSSGYKKLKLAMKDIENMQEIYLTSTVYELDEIVLSANKWEQAKIDLSSRIESINKDVISFRNPQTSADLIGQTDYVYVQKSQMGGGSPMIRGFSTNRVLLVVDGVRMNNAIFRSGNLQNIISLDANAIENSEVLFGPGSVMYGSDAIGGVMDFHTLSPRFNFDGWKVNGNAMIRTNSANNEKTGHFDFNVGNNKLAFLTSFSYSDYDNMIMGANGDNSTEHFIRSQYQTRINNRDTTVNNPNPKEQVNTGYSQVNFMQKIKYKINETTEIEGAYHYSETSDIPRYDRLITYRGDNLRDGRWDYGPQIWSLANLKVTNYNSNKIYDLVKFIVAYQTFEESRITRGFGSNNEATRTEKVGALSVNLDFDKKINKLNLGYGLEYVQNDISSVAISKNINTNETRPTDTRYPDGSDWSSMAAYFTGKYDFTEKFLLNFGLRYTQFIANAEFSNEFYDFQFQSANINDGSFSGSIGGVYKLNNKFHTFMNLSTGFRAPNIDDLGKVFETLPGLVIVPNPNLTSEVAYNGEIGLAGLVFDKVYFDISTYYTLLNNVLSRRNFQFNGQDSIIFDEVLSQVQAIQNLDQAYIYGIQAGIKVELPFNLELSSKINYQKGEEFDGQEWTPLRHAAPLFGSTKLNWKYKLYQLEFFANYNGGLNNNQLALSELDKPHLYAKDKNGDSFYQSWITLNIKGAINISNQFTFFFGFDNLTDIRYITYSSGIVSPGRSVNASLKYSF